MGTRRQSGSTASVLLVTVLFFVSFGASAGATVLVSSGSDAEPSIAAGATASPSASPTSSPTPRPSTTATAAPVPEPEPSPSVATKRQIKSATATLCEQDADSLPTLSAEKADPKWARIWEVHLSQQGVTPGPIDGEFDPRTVTSTKQLQRTLGVADSGKVGSATWAALWTDQCYVAPAPVPTEDWQPSYSGGGGGSTGGGGSSGGGGTLDRVE